MKKTAVLQAYIENETCVINDKWWKHERPYPVTMTTFKVIQSAFCKERHTKSYKKLHAGIYKGLLTTEYHTYINSSLYSKM